MLGAGASASIKKDGKPLIPDVSQMTKLMKVEVGKTKSKDVFLLVAKQLEKAKQDPNVEDYLTYVRSLAEIADTAQLEGLSLKSLRELDEEISKFIRTCTTATLPSDATPFDQLAIWIRSANRIYPVEVFTLNYDLLVEQALERNKVPYFDGFLGSREAFFDAFAIDNEAKNLPARWARLWKLHGSINWWVKATPDGLDVRRCETGEGYNSLIHPSHLKYDQARQMPYLAMLERLKRFLSLPRAVLVTSGYSFRDLHINALVVQTLAGQTSAVVLALMRSALAKYEGLEKMAESLPSLNVFARDAGIIGGHTGEWEKDDGAPTLPYGLAKETVGVGASAAEHLRSTLGDFVEMGKMLRDLTGDSMVGLENVQGATGA